MNDERAVLGSYRASKQAGDSVSFTFWGTDLDLVAVRDGDLGRLEVTLDGRQTTLDFSSEESEYQARVPVAIGLAEGEHEVRLTVAESPGGNSRVAIDGLIVRRSPTFYVRRSLVLLGCVPLAIGLFYALRRQWLSRGSV